MTHAFPTRRSSDLATAGKAVVDGLAMLDDVRDDVAAEIALAVRIVSVAAQFLDQKGRAEDVDAHGRQRHAGAAGNVRRLLRLFDEGGDHVLLVHMHDAEAAGFLRSEEHTSELQSLLRISYAVLY